MEEVEISSSSITHLLFFLLHRGRSSLARSPSGLWEKYGPSTAGNAVQSSGCPDAKVGNLLLLRLLSHPFRCLSSISDECKSGLSSLSFAFRFKYVT